MQTNSLASRDLLFNLRDDLSTPGFRTEHARLFAETRKLLGSGGKVVEVVEDEQEQGPEIVAEYYPGRGNGSPTDGGVAAASGPSTDATPAGAAPNAAAQTPSVGSNRQATSGTASTNPGTPRPAPLAGTSQGNSSAARNGSAASTGFHQLRNEFLTTARRVATATKRPISEVVEEASGGGVKYGDIGRLTEADAPKLRAALDVMNSTLTGAAR